jgi:hypothetical protein
MYHESSGRADNDKFSEALSDALLDVVVFVPGLG